MNKKQLGQFFTKNSDYILSGLQRFIVGKDIVDPFAGNGDLILWAKKNGAKKVKGYDIDKKYIDEENVFHNDGIKHPLKYKFILTNPPYLNINKADKETKREYFDKNNLEDLYQISLFSILDSEEGIVIVPINFLSAENSKKIRNIFFSKFKIIEMNYFTCQVFPDTTYNVIAFYYRKKNDYFIDKFNIKTHIYPQNKIMDIELKRDLDWTINGSFLKIIKNQKNKLGVYRLTEKDVEENYGDIEVPAAYNHIKNSKAITISKNLYDLIKSNIILLKAIDSGTEKGKISLENIRKYNVDCLVSKESSRHMIYFIFKNKISISEQERIINIFNREINKMRDKYSSLFLTNYRDNGRKRISFDFVYKFINYIYFNKINLMGDKRLLS
jgi:hypothetical protein